MEARLDSLDKKLEDHIDRYEPFESSTSAVLNQMKGEKEERERMHRSNNLKLNIIGLLLTGALVWEGWRQLAGH